MNSQDEVRDKVCVATGSITELLYKILTVSNTEGSRDLLAAQEGRVADDRVESRFLPVEDLGEDQSPVQRLAIERAVRLIGRQPRPRPFDGRVEGTRLRGVARQLRRFQPQALGTTRQGSPGHQVGVAAQLLSLSLDIRQQDALLVDLVDRIIRQCDDLRALGDGVTEDRTDTGCPVEGRTLVQRAARARRQVHPFELLDRRDAEQGIATG